MARFDMHEAGAGAMDATTQADILFEMGMMYATGRDCEMDLVAAHKWFNIAALKGSMEAARYRKEISFEMTRDEIAEAQRSAREWLAMH